MKIQFEGQCVIVTGAGGGLGRSISKAFAERGANLWLCDIDASSLEQVRQLCGGRCQARVLDVADARAVQACFEEATRESPVGILVNNAGGVLGQKGRPIEAIAPQEWQSILNVNLTGAFNCSQAAAPSMKRAGRGRVVNISSRAGQEITLTGIQAYAAAKAAQDGLTRQLAHELGPWGITVNAVAPGFIPCNEAAVCQWRQYGEQGQRRLIESIALRRLGTAEDIASAVLFLASEHASWITGEILRVDGGR